MDTRFFRDNAPFLATGMLLTFLGGFGQTFFISVFAGEIRSTFGLGHGAWGGIYSLGTFCSALVMIWAGALADRFRVRVLGAAVLALLAGACLSMALVPSVLMLPVVIFLLRFAGQGMTSHIAMVAMARWFVASRGKALSVAVLGFSLAEAILPVTAVTLMALAGWRMIWVGAAVLLIAMIPVLTLLLRQERTPQSAAAQDHTAGMSLQHWTRNQALRHWLFWFMVPALLGPAAFYTAFFFQQVHYAAVKGWPLAQLVALFPLYTAVSVASMTASGALIDRLGTARLIPFCLLPVAGAFVVFALARSPAEAAFGFVLLGLTQGAYATLPNAFWAEFYGTRHLGSVKAMGAAVMVLGSAVGPGLTGLLISQGVGIERQYLAIAVYFLAASALMMAGIARARPLLSGAPEPG